MGGGGGNVKGWRGGAGVGGGGGNVKGWRGGAVGGFSLSSNWGNAKTEKLQC